MAFKWFGREPVSVAGRLSHIAFIMDGNGRWATKRGLPREAGHQMGAKNLRRVVATCHQCGIDTVTVYAFSTENWKRPPHEVEALMRLVSDYVDEMRATHEQNWVHVRFVGDLTVFDASLRERMAAVEEETSHYEMTLNIAFNYGARQEIVHAVHACFEEGITHPDEVDISRRLYTYPSPDPDLVVRTGGEMRISNFLLWQSAYTEYVFTPTLWPDLSKRELERILAEFLKRHRRFGGL